MNDEPGRPGASRVLRCKVRHLMCCILPLVAGCTGDPEVRASADAGASSVDASGVDGAPRGDQGAGGAAAVDADSTVAPVRCGPWEVPDLPGGGCVPVGPPCADGARDDEGRCTVAACEPGERATADGRCEGLGPAGCAPGRAGDEITCEPAACSDLAGLPLPGGASCGPVGLPGCVAPLLDADGVCRPLPDRCGEDEIAAPQKGCVPLFDAVPGCGSDPWAAVVAAPGDVHVAPAAPGAPPGEGSRAAPFTTIAEALAAASPGGRVLLAPGVWDEPVHATADVTLLAACPGSVTLAGVVQTGAHPAAVWADGAQIHLDGLRITADGVGVLATGGGRATVAHADVSGCLLAAVAAIGSGSSVGVMACRLGETRMALLGDRMAGLGALADGGGAITLADSAVVGARTWGVNVRGAGSVGALSGVSIAATESNDEGLFGRPVQVQWGGALTVSASWLGGGRDAGAYAFEGTLTVEDSVVEGTRPLTGTRGGAYDGRFGEGVAADGGSQVVVRRTLILENTGSGVSAYGEGTSIRLEDSRVHATAPGFVDTPGDAGRGAEAAFGGRLEVVRSAITANREAGVFVNGADASALVDGSLVSGTTPAAGGGGDGVLAIDGGVVQLADSVVVANTASGVLARGAGTRVELTRCEVARTSPGADADGAGYGLVAQEGASVVASSTSIRGNAGAGVHGAGVGTTVALTGCLVRGTEPNGLGTHGRGVNIQQGASATLSGVTIEGSRDIGLFAHLPGATLVADALLVRDTAPEEATGGSGRGVEIQHGHATLSSVVVSGCPDGSLLVSSSDARVSLSGAALLGADHPGNGAVVQAEAELTLHDVVVEGARGSGALAANGARLTVDGVSVRGVALTDVTTTDGEVLAGIGDGLAAIDGAILEATAVRAEACGRAGVLWESSGGAIERSELRENAYGVVLQRTDTPAIDDTNRILDNAVLDVWTDGSLPTPPPPVPASL